MNARLLSAERSEFDRYEYWLILWLEKVTLEGSELPTI